MKKLLSFLVCSFIGIAAFAHTINWYVDGSIYQTTTCNSGEDITPPTAPTKYGYTFIDWRTYTPIEYIENTGTQWIDTGVMQTLNSKVSVTFASVSATIPSVSRVIIYGGLPDHNARFYVTLSSTGYFQIGLGKGVGRSTTRINTNKHTAIIDNKLLAAYFDGNSVTSTDYTRATDNSNIKIFYDINSAIAKIYSVSIYDDDILVRDFIPVLDKNGTPCMYDLVEHKYYYNSGTGNFIAGPEI